MPGRAQHATLALGAELVGRMLATTPDIDAIFCCNDDLAHGAIYQCQRLDIIKTLITKSPDRVNFLLMLAPSNSNHDPLI